MSIDHSFIIRKLQNLPEMFVIFSQLTKHPFVTCGEESFNDQIHIFTEQDKAQAFVKEHVEQQKLSLIHI